MKRPMSICHVVVTLPARPGGIRRRYRYNAKVVDYTSNETLFQCTHQHVWPNRAPGKSIGAFACAMAAIDKIRALDSARR